jgi:membrane protease YdiL (CAAX protease family)
MKVFLSKHNWWFYFILTFAISWSVWFLGSILLPEDLFLIALVPGVFGPFLAAVLIIRISKGKATLRSWLRKIFNLRISVRLYLLGGLFLPFLLAGMHHLIYMILGGQSGLELSMDWLLYPVYLIPTALLSGGNEEPGWRGYITPVLLKRFGILPAHVIIGILWGLWHLPLYYTNGWGSEQQSFVGLLIYCIPLSMILTWLYYKSRWSVIPVMLMHAGSNVVSRYFPMNTRVFESVEDEYTLIKILVYGSIAILLLILTKGKLGYIKDELDI